MAGKHLFHYTLSNIFAWFCFEAVKISSIIDQISDPTADRLLMHQAKSYFGCTYLPKHSNTNNLMQ